MTRGPYTVAEIAKAAGITPSDFRTRVMRGRAPKPDFPDLDTVPNRRMPKWAPATIEPWLATLIQRRAGLDRLSNDGVASPPTGITDHDWESL